MGGALAVLAAASTPERVERIVLVSPAGLPLSKPLRMIVRDFLRAARDGRYRRDDLLFPLTRLARYPRAAAQLARVLRELDLSHEMARVRALGVPAVVIGCSTDTLTPPATSLRTAELLGGRYREVGYDGGHVWMFGNWERLARELRRALHESPTDARTSAPAAL